MPVTDDVFVLPPGMPLRMTPNFEDLSCEFAFGQDALPAEEDPLMQEVRRDRAQERDMGSTERNEKDMKRQREITHVYTQNKDRGKRG